MLRICRYGHLLILFLRQNFFNAVVHVDSSFAASAIGKWKYLRRSSMA